MSALHESYQSAAHKLARLRERLRRAKQAIQELNLQEETHVQARIKRLREQLEKIDEYQLKIAAFRQLAERNLESKNVLTIEAPPGYRVNLNRLRQWSMMIDPTASNDPYAQRVYVVAKCDELFLEKKKKEFTERVAALERQDVSEERSAELKQLRAEEEAARAAMKGFLLGEEMLSLARAAEAANRAWWYQIAPVRYADPVTAAPTLAPGACGYPLELPEELRQTAKGIFGQFYDAVGSRVLLPLELDSEQEFAMEIACAPSRAHQLDKALQNLALNLVEHSPAGSRKLYVLDGVRYNSSALGSLRQLEDSFAVAPIPRNGEQFSAILEQLVSSFSDMDEVMELSDSVLEYNQELQKRSKDGKPLPRAVVILIGRPNSFQGTDREHIQRILHNYARYGISLISVVYRSEWKKEEEASELTEYAAQSAVRIRMMPRDTYVHVGYGPQQRFTWYTMVQPIGEDYARSLRERKLETHTVGNEYIKRFSLTDRPKLTRDYKPLILPFGINGKDQEGSISFENENFAAYLVGASRSGKSTMLHTLIAGLIRNYHPDNVELWLADFKQLEFKRYIRHLPPHVKYVLLDESTELVFDLVDKLTDEMMERQKLFARLGVQRIDQIDPKALTKPLPLIFVILDEFSIMSQSLAESPVYKLRLQNILAKGAALGLRFLFSSQTFTTGVTGLSLTARAQIQQRIAMKGTRDEISATLELSADLKTDQVRNWMDALPPHYALVKARQGPDKPPMVLRYLVMYFKDYKPRDDMIEDIRASMRCVDTYDPTHLDTYVDKHPVLVDGNTFEAFLDRQFRNDAVAAKAALGADAVGDERFLAFGSPRLMERVKLVTLTAEARENLLLIARSADQPCAASILRSAARAFQLQGGEVEIWAYGRNRLFRTYQKQLSKGCHVVEGIDAVCDAIWALKQRILNRESDRRLILLIGMDRICMDFDYVEMPGTTPVGEQKHTINELRQGFIESGAVLQEGSNDPMQMKSDAWNKVRLSLKSELKRQGKSASEIKAAIQEERVHFEQAWLADHPLQLWQKPEAVSQSETPTPQEETKAQEEKPKEEHVSGAYNAREDFVYVLRQGSKLGCHFMMALTSFSDLKGCNIKPDYFRYHMAFQLSVDDSRSMFNNKSASTLPEHICQFDDTFEHYSFRPYLHPGIGWEGWSVDEADTVTNPFQDVED